MAEIQILKVMSFAVATMLALATFLTTAHGAAFGSPKPGVSLPLLHTTQHDIDNLRMPISPLLQFLIPSLFQDQQLSRPCSLVKWRKPLRLTNMIMVSVY